jgi:hypothetical protein
VNTTDHIASLASEPDNWLLRAVHLLSSAELIFSQSSKRYNEQIKRLTDSGATNTADSSIEDSTEYLRVGLLLAGYGFESLLKYGYVKRNQKSVYSTILAENRIPDVLKTHSLLDLADLIQLPMQQEVVPFLKKLSDHSVWAGRYPVPLTSRQFDESLFSLRWGQNDVEIYYQTRNLLFSFFGLDYNLLRHRGVGLTSGST